MKVVKLLLASWILFFCAGCVTKDMAHETFLAAVEKSVKRQHEYAQDDKYCQDKSAGHYSSDCIERAEAMSNIECIINRQSGHSTEKSKSTACACYESSETDQLTLCTAWLDSK